MKFAISTLLASLFILLSASSRADEGQSIKNLYNKAMIALKQHNYKKASSYLKAILPTLAKHQKRTTPGSKGHTALLLGQCDILYHLGKSALAEKTPNVACQYFSSINSLVGKLPKQWKQWRVHPSLPRRINVAKTKLNEVCRTVPSTLVVVTKPAKATIRYRNADGPWLPMKQGKIQTLAQQIQFSIQANGHIPKQTRWVSIARWKTTTFQFQLKKRPVLKATSKGIAKRIAPQQTPKATPITKKWWFWTVTSVVVVGATTATIVALTARHQSTLRSANPTQGQPGVSVW